MACISSDVYVYRWKATKVKITKLKLVVKKCVSAAWRVDHHGCTLLFHNKLLTSVLWHCIVWWCVGVVVHLKRGADCLQLIPLPSQNPTVLPHLNSDWFYLSGTGLPRLSWKRVHQVRVVVVVVVEPVDMYCVQCVVARCMFSAGD